MNFLDPRLPSRFWDKAMPCPMSGCWLWTAVVNRQDYGRIRLDARRLVLAHRHAYEALVGAIPDGLELDHRCKNTRCCNPAHLEPVTHAENVRRSTAGDHMKKRSAAQTHCKHGHEYTPENTVTRPHRPGARSCRTCERDGLRNRRRAKARVA